MDPMLVVSPHLDDAVLSAGQVLAGREDSWITTVFAGQPNAWEVSTTWDRNCGYPNARAAWVGRKAEDDQAAHLLRATPIRMDFLDQQYRELGLMNHVTDTSDEAIAWTIETTARHLGDALAAPIVMLGPMGLKHPDHHTTRRALQLAARALGDRCELWIYEDLPARLLWPEEVPDALAWWRGMGWDPVHAFLGTGPIEIKEAAVRAYRSQLWCPEFGGDALHHVLVPERVWRCWPC